MIFLRVYMGWDVSLATNHSILLLIRITIRIEEFLTEYFTTGMTYCKIHAVSAALAEVCGLRVLVILTRSFSS